MSKARKFDFTQGIRSVVKTRHSNRKLNTKTLNLLDVILNDVSGRLIKQFNTEYDAYPKSDNKPCHLFAQKAVEKTFVGKLKKHAVYESTRQLALFDTGSLKYNPEEEIEYLRTVEKETRTKIKESRPPPSPDSSLQSAVAKMCPSSHTLRKDGKEFLSDQLQQFASRVVAEVECGENEMQPKDIRQVLPKFLGPKVLNIAVSEGNRSLVLHANDFLTFKPKLPPSKPRVVATETDPEVPEPGIFKTGLKKLLLGYDKDATLDKKAIEFIDKTLYQIAEFLAMYSVEVSQANGKLDICDMDVTECVKNEFPGMLKDHALIQGFQDVEAYFQGLLKFQPSDMTAAAKKRKASTERPVKRLKTVTKAVKTVKKGESDKKPKSKKKVLAKSVAVAPEGRKVKKMNLDFTSAILDCLPIMFPDIIVSADKRATAEIEKILNNVFQCVNNTSSGNSESGVVGIMEVNDAVEKLLPGDLQDFACTFAATTLAQRLSSGVQT